jgi:predicted Zn-dependent protease
MKIRKANLLFMLFCCALAGCTTEYNLATQQQETLLYDTDKEVKIGEAVAPRIEAQFKVITDVDVNERVERILDRIVAVCDRKDLVYFIKVLDDDPINAVSLPGGYVYVFRGLIDKVDNDDQLAGVIAHEVAHITAKHGVKRMQNAYAALLLQVASTQANGNVAGGTNLALNSLFLEYSQQAEFEADRLGVKYLKKAGYDPKAMAQFLRKLKEAKEKEPLQAHSYWRTHPYLSQRIGMANQAVTGKLEFRDYLNMTGDE